MGRVTGTIIDLRSPWAWTRSQPSHSLVNAGAALRHGSVGSRRCDRCGPCRRRRDGRQRSSTCWREGARPAPLLAGCTGLAERPQSSARMEGDRRPGGGGAQPPRDVRDRDRRPRSGAAHNPTLPGSPRPTTERGIREPGVGPRAHDPGLWRGNDLRASPSVLSDGSVARVPHCR